MLVPAVNYETELNFIWHNVWFDEKYKFYNYDSYYADIEIENETWSKHQFVSISSNYEILGYIAYGINRQNNSCRDLEVINFTDNSLVFGVDLGRALKDIFEKYNFSKIRFSVVVGNPIESSYDKIVKRYGGRIVGTYKDEIRLIDGNLYDRKDYEIMREDYLEVMKRRNKNDRQ